MRQKTEAFIYFYPLGLPLVTGNALALGSEMLNEFCPKRFFFLFQISAVQKQGFSHEEIGVKFVMSTRLQLCGPKKIMWFPDKISLFSN